MTDLDVHLGAIRAGDAAAFGSWLAGAEPIVRSRLASFAAAVDTEAVLQEALLRVWQVAPRFTADDRPNALLRFAIRVARNGAIDQARRDRVVYDDPGELDVDVEPALPDPLLRRVIETCRERLPDQPGRALAARLDAAGGRSDADLAASLGMKLNTFLKNVGRARALLLECLGLHGVTVEAP